MSEVKELQSYNIMRHEGVDDMDYVQEHDAKMREEIEDLHKKKKKKKRFSQQKKIGIPPELDQY